MFVQALSESLRSTILLCVVCAHIAFERFVLQHLKHFNVTKKQSNSITNPTDASRGLILLPNVTDEDATRGLTLPSNKLPHGDSLLVAKRNT